MMGMYSNILHENMNESTKYSQMLFIAKKILFDYRLSSLEAIKRLKSQ
tara:strand:+ start:165 stop:308 length:144 start_codon:yes stop_codon:yes gene_type:complete